MLYVKVNSGTPLIWTPTGEKSSEVFNGFKSRGENTHLKGYNRFDTFITEVVSSSLSLSASKNVSDWWLAYWISHSHDHPGTNLTHTSPPPSPTHTLSLTAATVDSGGRVWGGLASGALVNETVLKEAQDNLVFYLAIYGGLAAANSVSS